jgi:hypothetical protein
MAGGTAPFAGAAGGRLGGATAGGAGGTVAGGGSSVGTGGAQGGAVHTRDHCVDGYDPDPSDATMKADGLVEYTKANQIDTTVQPEVLSWFQAHVWDEAHFQWHNIRRCKGNGMVEKVKGGGIDPCSHPDLIPADLEGKGPGDGLQFLAMHRHMIQSLKQLFPKHTEQFEGWEHFPTKSADVPAEWRDIAMSWPAATADAGAKADDPASYMASSPNDANFASEGAFGQWIQSVSGLHGALHFKWVRNANDDHGLGNQFRNIDNYMFWKMHGWIDKIWDRYRAAKGKTPNDQDIKDAVLAQCRQMDQYALLVKPDLGTGGCTAAPKQSGVFADTIRPAFERTTNNCTGCHGSGASGGLTLGGNECIKSSDLVANLVNKASTTGGQFKLVVPSDPEHSWLYLKVSGKAGTAGCTPTGGVTCNTDTMPQGAGGVTMSQAELDALRQWILDGAPAPQ